MNHNNFKNIFFSTAQVMTSSWEKRDFVIDDYNNFALSFIIAYFSDTRELEKLGGKSHKGIYLYGDIGTGKSYLFEILEKIYLKTKNSKLRFKKTNTISLIDCVRAELSRSSKLSINDESLYTRYTYGTVYFDDLGAETVINHFGNQIDVMSDILQLRYSHLNRTNCRTFISSNLCPKQVKERYGERLYDRLYEMFNFIELEGKTRRK